jgi:hypothetical protein
MAEALRTNWGGGEPRLFLIRAAIEAEVERLIGLLDWLDGDPDLELENCAGECPDDVGELPGACWLEVA